MNALTLSPNTSISTLFNWRSVQAWVILFVGWNIPAMIALSYYYLNQTLVGGAFDWSYAMTTTLSNWYLWMLMTPGAWFAAQYLPLTPPRNWGMIFSGHLVGMLLLLGIQAFGNLLTFRIFGLHPTMNIELWEVHFILRAQINILTYILVIGIYYGLDYYQKYQLREQQAVALQAQLAQAQLMALKMQLQPHFLFNTLNSVAALVRKNETKQAVTMLGRLGEFLRIVLESKGEQEVQLSHELSFTQRYLDIEKVRFNERLQIEVKMEPATLEAYVPNLILQPLVENTIKHGIAPHANAGIIQLHARIEGTYLMLEVGDDGPGLKESSGRQGIGLTNTRNRLEELYGDDFSFVLGRSALGGMLVSIRIPYRTSPVLSASLLMVAP